MISKEIVKYYGFLLSVKTPYSKHYYVSETKFKECREKINKVLTGECLYVTHCFEEDDKESLCFSLANQDKLLILFEHYAGKTVQHFCSKKQLKELFELE